MQSITAREIMVTKLVTLRPEMDVHDAVHLLLRNRISGAPVVDPKGRYLGVFSEKCSMSVLLDSAYEQLPTCDVGSYMDTEAMTISEDTQLLSIAQVFLLSGHRRLPVIDDDGRLLGQVSRRDVVRAGIKQLDAEMKSESSILYLSAIMRREDAPIG
ncbi:MAG: CBS domain-containing protein [Planctomycetales bacterium]|nr:CBS domain-containing protein [Planctomycetales bacterium]